jgi:hypothetical protein
MGRWTPLILMAGGLAILLGTLLGINFPMGGQQTASNDAPDGKTSKVLPANINVNSSAPSRTTSNDTAPENRGSVAQDSFSTSENRGSVAQDSFSTSENRGSVAQDSFSTSENRGSVAQSNDSFSSSETTTGSRSTSVSSSTRSTSTASTTSQNRTPIRALW